MQRIGMLYFVCRNASLSQAIGADALAKKIRADLRRLRPVGSWENVRPYFERYRGFPQRYRNKKMPYNEIEYQDELLADPELVSTSGAISDEVVTDLIDEAIMLNLVRSTSHTLTDRGKAMLHLWDQLQNPLALNAACVTVATYWYLAEDGDAVRAIYRNVNLDDHRFDREALGPAIVSAIRSLQVTYKVMTVSDRQLMQRLKELAFTIEHPKGDASGSGRPAIQAATIRCEHPVDLRMLQKVTVGEYRYVVPGGSLLHKLVNIDGDIGNYLDGDFAADITRRLQNGTPCFDSSASSTWELFYEAYSLLKNPMGYASLHESMVLAQGFASSRGLILRIAEGKTEVLGRQKNGTIRIAIGRDGRPDFIKVNHA